MNQTKKDKRREIK